MVETLHNMMIVKKEIEGMEAEIREIEQKTGLVERNTQLGLLKKIYQAELRLCMEQGVTREGSYRLVNRGRKVRRVNIDKLRQYSDLYIALSDRMTVTLKDVQDIVESYNLDESIIDEICDVVEQDKFDIVDITEG